MRLREAAGPGSAVSPTACSTRAGGGVRAAVCGGTLPAHLRHSPQSSGLGALRHQGAIPSCPIISQANLTGQALSACNLPRQGAQGQAWLLLHSWSWLNSRALAEQHTGSAPWF